MKNFIKMFFALVLAVFLLGAGYYLVLVNLSYLLATGKPTLQWYWRDSAIMVRTGDWAEVIPLRIPFQITQKNKELVFNSKSMTITVITSPKFRIQWKRSLSRRRSIKDGEY